MTTEQADLYQLLPELRQIAELQERAGGLLNRYDATSVDLDGMQLPVPVLSMGSDDPQAPAIGLFGGVHGVERIGMEVVVAYLQSLVESLSWAPSLQQQVAEMHIVVMPMVNPTGVIGKTRCNANGVDLMRNAPQDADGRVALLVGGQRVSRRLPWYRGRKNVPMEAESQALCQVVSDHLLGRPFSIALDCHSGYGLRDRIWFPYAGSRKPFPQAAEVAALKDLFDRSYPNHSYYDIEPQSHSYTTHGDLWDYLHARSMQQSGVFLPLTLEMGSWQWIRKNPRQIFRFPNLFNPVLPHRHQRILRRHLVLIDFLLRAVHGFKHWAPVGEQRDNFMEIANQRWYSSNEQ